jgi:hypothetical protein
VLGGSRPNIRYDVGGIMSIASQPPQVPQQRSLKTVKQVAPQVLSFDIH